MIKGRGEKVALVTNQESFTYSDLKRNILAYSELFKDLSGQRVAIFSENRPEWVFSFYAAWINNCLPVPIDFMSGIDDIAFILNDCRPEVIFCSEDKQKVLLSALKQVKHEPRLFVFEEQKKLLLPETDEKFELRPEKDETAVIIYTSGTTGSPKGVMLSFDNLMVNIEAITDRTNIYNENDVIMILLPLHHVFPLIGTMVCPLYSGSQIAASPSLNADDVIKTLQKHKVTILIGVPRLFSLIRKGIIDKINQSGVAKKLFALAKKLNSKRFSKFVFKTAHQKFGGVLKYMVSGGAALDPEVAKDFYALGFDILEGYGMTETAPMIAFTRPGKFRVGSAGLVVPGTKMEIRNGEIVASGRNVMQGYFGRKEETEEVLKDNWLYTGDLGKIDKEGYLFVTGRKKEIIVLSNGKNINPAEIETKLEKDYSYIKETGVFIHNDLLNVVIVPEIGRMRADGIIDAEEYLKNQVIKKYNEKASASKRLIKFHISNEELPRTRLSKLQRFKLVEFVKENSGKPERRQEKIENFKELSTLLSFLKEQISGDVSPYDRLQDDLGLDSLSRISLIVYLDNTFGINIPEESLSDFETVLQLAEFVKNKKTRITPEVINWTSILKEKINFNLPKTGVSFNFFNFSYKAIFRSMFRLRQEGAKNIPSGPCIIAPNHQSFLDGFMVASLLKRKTMKHTYIYAKEKHWRKRWQKFLARKNNVILMDINKDLMISIQKMAEVLRKGKNLIIFPEGTRSKDGTLGELKKTFAILANELNVPVIPVTINGAHKAMPVGARFPRLFKKISVKFNKPVYPGNLGTDKILEKVQRIMLKQVKTTS